MTIDSNKRKISKRGFTVQGIVVSDRRKKTVTVQRDLVTYVPKYRRYARKISKIAAHNPDEIDAKIGDLVEIAECRKISKTKAWTVSKIIKKGQGHIIPGQVKSRDESQASHIRKHGGASERLHHKSDESNQTTDAHEHVQEDN
jgi:small subunit ribosomal protein S17